MKKIINPFLNEKQLKGRLFQLRVKTYKKGFPCFVEGCNQPAIDSHILQKNGILHHIAEKQHLMTLRNNNITGAYTFDRVGVNDIFTFKGFCNSHDTDIFKPIESGSFKLTDYKNQLLLSFRGLLNELRKKEILIEYYNAIISDPELAYYMRTDMLALSIQNHQLAINDIEKFKELFETDLKTGSENFRFVVREFNRIPVCSSAIFSFETDEQMFKKYGTINFLKPLDTIFINLLPHSKKSYLVIGTKKTCDLDCQFYIERFATMNEQELKKEISDILFRNIETWICSESFYKSNISQHMKYIQSFKKATAFEHGTERPVDINIFENCR